MIIRIAIVFLLVLNLGVAAWWLLKPAAETAPAAEQIEGVATLKLVSEASDAERASAARTAVAVPDNQTPSLAAQDMQVQGSGLNAPVASSIKPAVTAENVAAVQSEKEATENNTEATSKKKIEHVCYSIGPLQQAQIPAMTNALSSILQKQTVRHVQAKGGSGWRVWLPAQPTRDEAKEVIAKLQAAGISDHFIINQGDEVNSIALGRYGTEEAAKRRETALRDAGFSDVKIGPLTPPTEAKLWLDIVATEKVQTATIKAHAENAELKSVTCATAENKKG